MQRFTTAIVTIALALFATAAMAQVRGKARLQGQVVAQDTGKPIEGAKITIAPSDGSTVPIITKTNKQGRWSALGLTGGQWNVDIEAAGYAASRGAISVTELQMLPPIKSELAPEVKQEAAPAPEEEQIVVGGVAIPQEVADAIAKGQELLAAGQAKEAIVELEKALPALPDNIQLKQVLAQAYYKAGDLKKAIAMLEAVNAADASNTTIAVLLTNLYLENGQLEEGKAKLASLPADAITDPTVYVNIGILFLNRNNPEEAVKYLTKAVDLDMTQAPSYYYRGLAYIQGKKAKEAKADFQKVLELAPDSTEGHDAKQMLDSMK